MLMEPWQLQPAHDTGLTPAERFRSIRRESGLLESLAQQACFSTLRFYFAIAHRLAITGRDRLPPHGPFVLAANHCSHLDALILGAALRPRHRERAFPIAAGDVFFQTTAVSVFSAVMINALPMWRKNCGPHALAELRRKLQEEKAIFIIFPEGGRTRTGSIVPFKHGLGMLVAQTNVPVVPCGLVGTFEALPPNRKIPRPTAIKLVIGDPLQFASTANDRAGWSQIAQSVESAVRNLTHQKAL
jgi:1-acyl-sn-glycerol-3-phosphate acyltransferase